MTSRNTRGAVLMGSLVLCMAPACAQATQPTASVDGPDTDDATVSAGAAADSSPHRLQYSLGLRWKAGSLEPVGNQSRFSPMIGLRYGRWRLGASGSQEWLRFSSIRRESSLDYDWLQSSRWQLGLSMRIQNLTQNESYDGLTSGRKTLRGRTYLTYLINPRWALSGEVTHDVLNRGDGTTFTLGASYAWPLDERNTLNFSAGSTWANAKHWSTANSTVPESAWSSGWGSVGFGVSYRHLIARHWASFATWGRSRNAGPTLELLNRANHWNAQIGLLYFSD